ncbi:MAG TPA: hypothetical protein PLB59_00245 [Bacteroidales bacterium]|nr:DUF4249 family protein [Bacteroidales bacterium]HNZ41949.1 hypothetical protein [Bacteroidales bacterium]HPB24250.1 hypothetical protein [Bacteroidales bacterium]HPI28927.1 hypothetical protein [Bacteroidales bacterium]HQN14845.1 hypothetical protein [Bacteroidales bacterium]
MRKAILPVLLILSLFLNSCKTDFDINAEKKDIAIVYGLLDQTQPVQYVKITRAFLGEGNAIEMASDAALSSYGNDLEVTITQISNGNEVNTFVLEKTTIADKDSGMFYYPAQDVYRFIPGQQLAAADSFRLKIRNLVTGNQVTAATNLIHDFSIMKPSYNPENPLLGLVGSNLAYNTLEASWKSGKNGRVYEPWFRFHYREVNLTTHDTTDKFVDWHLSTVKSETLKGGETLLTNYNSEDFYRRVAAEVPVDYNVVRLIGMVDFVISAGADELSIYIDLNKPSNSIIQERPLYTNIGNGLGIFSARYTKKLTYNLTSFSIDKLMHGEYTSELNFQ